MNGPKLALCAALAALVAIPWLVLTDRSSPQPASVTTSVPAITPSPAAPLDAALARAIMGGIPSDAPDTTDAQPATATDVPQLSGIVGRLPDHAVALVKRANGGTRALGIGETIDGWRLETLASDAALFVRDTRRVRVEITAAPAPDGQ